MDFIHDTLLDGATVRILSVVDHYTRECLALVPSLASEARMWSRCSKPRWRHPVARR